MDQDQYQPLFTKMLGEELNSVIMDFAYIFGWDVDFIFM